MDGFEGNSGVIVVAATNRSDILDNALLRPGRFDRRVTVGLPDVKGREQILNVHIRNKKLAEGITLNEIAKRALGTRKQVQTTLHLLNVCCFFSYLFWWDFSFDKKHRKNRKNISLTPKERLVSAVQILRTWWMSLQS